MTRLIDDFGRHPVGSALHGAQDLALGEAEVDAQALGAPKVNQLDDPIGHQHHVAPLDVPEVETDQTDHVKLQADPVRLQSGHVIPQAWSAQAIKWLCHMSDYKVTMLSHRLGQIRL